MRQFIFILALILSALWIVLLNNPLGTAPALGKFFNPVAGFWANAESFRDSVLQLRLPENELRQKVSITFDRRLVPHVKAQNDEDLYFAEGYLHAYFRLWQMDMQTRAAAGRLSEVVGEAAFSFDREQRRKGMIWAAENSLQAIEKNPATREMLNAYTRGVNSYIGSLNYRKLPLLYKLMSFQPEKWTNLKCVLLLKYMADDLSGHVDDIPLSYLHSALPSGEFNDLFPERNEITMPVVPSGTKFNPPSKPFPPVPPGKIFADFSIPKIKGSVPDNKVARTDESGKGSNNWVVNGKRTANHTPILCNDPHLNLNLPSIWYEIQLSAPGVNCYGVSIPGAPAIVIGFNDSISWGVTNNYRDVKDYYELRSDQPGFYVLDSREVPFRYRVEKIFIKGQKLPFMDTVRYAIQGPVIYDDHYPEPSGSGKMLAVKWMGHRGTNEFLALYRLNRADNYKQFVDAIAHFECPAQNFIYADRLGNIAIWGQGRFINKWKDQGRFVMRGDISATLWGDTIPVNENPHCFNPPQNYLESANQTTTDSTYPYWYNGDFSEFRSWEIQHFLKNAHQITPQQMMALQNNSWSYIAAKLAPCYYLYGAAESRKPENKAYFTAWNDSLTAGSKTATSFKIWWHFLYNNIWKDKFKLLPATIYPSQERTLQIILKDSASQYFDDHTTAEKETLAMIAQKSFHETFDSIRILERNGGSEWYKVKNTSIMHLSKLKAFSFTGLETGGGASTINAMKQNHGPSWRMIVEMGPQKIQAYCNYPGGQSGNPGSRYYAQFLDHWVKGKYYQIDFIPRNEK